MDSRVLNVFDVDYPSNNEENEEIYFHLSHYINPRGWDLYEKDKEEEMRESFKDLQDSREWRRKKEEKNKNKKKKNPRRNDSESENGRGGVNGEDERHSANQLYWEAVNDEKKYETVEIIEI